MTTEQEIQAIVEFLRERGVGLVLSGREATDLCREFGIVTHYPERSVCVLYNVAEYMWRRLNESVGDPGPGAPAPH